MNKSTLIALIIFAALAAAAVATLREKPERGITRISFAAVDPEKVDRVVIQGANPIELKKDGEKWTADGKRADATAVKALLDGVKNVESAELVTRNHERYVDLGVDDEKGAHVQAFTAGKQSADFVVGNAATGGVNVRVGDAVYVVRRASKGTFARDRAQWLDRKLFTDAATDATRVEVKLVGQPPYALVKDGEDWKLEDTSALPAGFRFDKNAARGVATTLVSAQAKDVLSDDPGAAITGLSETADTLIFKTAAGDPRALILGSKKDDGTVYARASARPEVVMLPEYVAKNLRKSMTDLRDLSLMSFDPTSAKRVEIVKDKDRIVLTKNGDAWQIAEASPAAAADFVFDPQSVARRVAAISTTRAVADAGSDAKTGLDKPTQKIDVTLADDRVVTLAFGSETQWDNAPAVYARGNADTKTYLVRPMARDNVLGGVATFAKRPDSPLGNIDPHALSNLPPEVRESLMKQIEEKKRKDEIMQKLIQQQGQK